MKDDPFRAFLRAGRPAPQSQSTDADADAGQSRGPGAQSGSNSSLTMSKMDAQFVYKLSTLNVALGTGAAVMEETAKYYGTWDTVASAKALGTAGLVCSIALDAWARGVDPKMTRERFWVNTGVSLGAYGIGGVPGLTIGGAYAAVDRLGGEPEPFLVTMDAHGKLHAEPWNYGGGWGGMAQNLHPDNYQRALMMRSWFLQIGFVLPSDVGF